MSRHLLTSVRTCVIYQSSVPVWNIQLLVCFCFLLDWVTIPAKLNEFDLHSRFLISLTSDFSPPPHPTRRLFPVVNYSGFLISQQSVLLISPAVCFEQGRTDTCYVLTCQIPSTCIFAIVNTVVLWSSESRHLSRGRCVPTSRGTFCRELR
jgi:hypothetical protein